MIIHYMMVSDIRRFKGGPQKCFMDILAHLSHNDKVSFCDHTLSIRRECMHPSVCKQFLQMTSRSKPLIGF